MGRRFIFKEVIKRPRQMVEADPKALDWSKSEIEAMAEVSDEDMDDTKNWLQRIGQKTAAALFDAEKE